MHTLRTGSGKTEIAFRVMINWILPQALGGNGGSVVFLDMDFRMNVLRFRHLLLARLTQAAQQQHQRSVATGGGEEGGPVDMSDLLVTDTEALLEECMNRVVLIRCVDELEAFSALEVLKYDLNHPSSSSSSSGPTLLVLDSLGSLLYERKAAESCRQGQSCFDFMMARALNRMVTNRSLSIIALKPSLLNCKRLYLPQGQGANQHFFPSMEHREYMPGQWAKLVTHRVTVVKEVIDDAVYYTAKLLSLVGPKGLVAAAGEGAEQPGSTPFANSRCYWFTIEGDQGVTLLTQQGENEVQ